VAEVEWAWEETALTCRPALFCAEGLILAFCALSLLDRCHKRPLLWKMWRKRVGIEPTVPLWGTAGFEVQAGHQAQSASRTNGKLHFSLGDGSSPIKSRIWLGPQAYASVRASPTRRVNRTRSKYSRSGMTTLRLEPSASRNSPTPTGPFCRMSSCILVFACSRVFLENEVFF